MKRSQMYKKINSKNGLFNHVNRNIVYPTVIFNSNLEEDNKNTAIQIVELNSGDDSIPETVHPTNYNDDHTWCNVTDISEEQQEDYAINRRARDKRRQNIEKDCHENASNKYYSEDEINQFFTDFYGIDCHDRGEGISTWNDSRPDFFTIINNRITSDTSSDSNRCDDIEIFEQDNTIQNEYWNDNSVLCEDRNILYENDCNAERTIWIYAVKNKGYLTENDIELMNIPSKATTSSSDEELIRDTPIIRRIATPIPTYIPRLNLPLSPTLPTVTEVTEANNLSSNNTDTNIKTKTTPIQKPWNGWLVNEVNNTQHINKYKSNPDRTEITNRYNVQANSLSPRERRRLRYTNINEQITSKVKKEPETLVYCEPTVTIKGIECTQNVKYTEKEIDEVAKSEDCVNLTEANTIKDEVSLDISNDIALEELNLQKPRIKLNTRIKKSKSDITDPIEKLDGNWIGNNDDVIEVYDYNFKPIEDKDTQEDLQNSAKTINDCAGNRLLIRNMSLLKPAEWTQYLPVTGSRPSLHLSISLNSDLNEKKSWFKRLLKCVHCCK